MADDDDVIYVDIEAKLNEGAAEKETNRLRDRLKKAGKVDIEPNLDEPAADKAAGKLKDRLKGIGSSIGDALGDSLDKATETSVDKAADKVRKRLDGIGQNFGEALGKEFGNLFSDSGDGVGSFVGKALKDQVGGITDMFSGGFDIGALPGQFDSLRNSIRETAEGLKSLAPEGTKAAGALAALSDAAGPLAVLLAGGAAVYHGLQDILHSPTGLDTSPERLGLKPTLPQSPTQTPANLMPLPGATQPVQLPPGIKPGTQYNVTQGDINDPFAGLLPPGVKPPSGATNSNVPSTPIIPSNPLVPNIAPPDTGGTVGTRSAFSGGIHATLVDTTHPDGSGGVPLIRNPDGSITSSNPSWAHLIQRESSGRNVRQGIIDANSGGNEAEGYFQITPRTWASHGGMAFAPNPLAASPEQQAAIAARILQGNPSGSDWGAGLPGRENAGALLAGLGGGPAITGGGASARPAGFGIPGLGGGGMGPLPPPTQPNDSGGGPVTQQPLGSGKGVGVSGGGILGAAEQAGVMAAGVAGFGGGAVAAQIAEQELNLAVQKGGQAAATLAAAPFETFGLRGGMMGAPSVNPMGGWIGKVISGAIGQQDNLPNIAGSAQPPKQKQQNQTEGQDPQGEKPTGPQGTKDDPMHVNVTNQPQPPQGSATSAMNTAPALASAVI